MEIKYVSSSLRLFSRNISPLSFHFHHLEAKYLKATKSKTRRWKECGSITHHGGKEMPANPTFT